MKSRWIFKGLSILVAAFSLALLAGYVGPEMRTDTRWFIVLLYLLPIAIGLWIIRGRKTTHIFIGILLNVFGTAIMQLANSWAGFMMSPVGVDGDGAFIGTVWRKCRFKKEDYDFVRFPSAVFIDTEFMNYIKSVDYLRFHFKGPEINIESKVYKSVFALADMFGASKQATLRRYVQYSKKRARVFKILSFG